jgi:hypothetical protein
MALRLGKLCGNGPELWLALQTKYDLERLSQKIRSEIETGQITSPRLRGEVESCAQCSFRVRGSFWYHLRLLCGPNAPHLRKQIEG